MHSLFLGIVDPQDYEDVLEKIESSNVYPIVYTPMDIDYAGPEWNPDNVYHRFYLVENQDEEPIMVFDTLEEAESFVRRIIEYKKSLV